MNSIIFFFTKMSDLFPMSLILNFVHQRVIQSSARGSLSFYSQSVLYLRAHDCSEIFPVIGYAIIIPIIICGCSAFQITEKLSSTSCLSKYSYFFPIFSINAFDYSNFFFYIPTILSFSDVKAQLIPN